MAVPSAPTKSVLSAAQVADRIQNLSDADTYRLKKLSEYLSFGAARPAQELRNEAIRRALDGTRNCPSDISILIFLRGVMRSVADADRKAQRRHPTLTIVATENISGCTLLDGIDPRLSPEEQIIRDEQLAEMRKKVVALFCDDLVAQTLVEGIIDGMEGEELRELVGLDEAALATKRRFIRRRIDKAFPQGVNT